jgi:hypothetical protein
MPMMPMARPMTRPMGARMPVAPMMAAARPGGMKKGGSAHNRADGCAERGHTKGTIVMCGGGMHKK